MVKLEGKIEGREDMSDLPQKNKSWLRLLKRKYNGLKLIENA